jgi:hypothetical protein
MDVGIFHVIPSILPISSWSSRSSGWFAGVSGDHGDLRGPSNRVA